MKKKTEGKLSQLFCHAFILNVGLFICKEYDHTKQGCWVVNWKDILVFIHIFQQNTSFVGLCIPPLIQKFSIQRKQERERDTKNKRERAGWRQKGWETERKERVKKKETRLTDGQSTGERAGERERC